MNAIWWCTVRAEYRRCMALEKGNVAQSKQGVVVNEYLQSVSNARVYSAGDAAATKGLPLTPIAGMEAAIVADNLLNGNHATANYKAVQIGTGIVQATQWAQNQWSKLEDAWKKFT